MAAFPLHKNAAGLLELLKAKNHASSPHWFGETLIPVLECREFYSTMQLLGTSGAATVGGLVNLTDTLQLTQPLGLKAISGQLTIGAAGGTNLRLDWGLFTSSGPTGEQITLGSDFVPSFVAGQVIGFGDWLPNWVPAGGTLLFVRASGTAAGVDHSLDCNALIENYASGG